MMKAPEEVNWIFPQAMTTQDIIKQEISDNDNLTSCFRIFGVSLLIIGIYCLFAPVITILSFISIIGSLAGAAAFVVALVLGLALGMLVIALSWIFYRPLLGLMLLICVGGLVYLMILLGQQQTPQTAQAFLEKI